MTESLLTEEEHKKLDEACNVIEEVMRKLGINRFATIRKVTELMFDKITVINRFEDVYRKI